MRNLIEFLEYFAVESFTTYSLFWVLVGRFKNIEPLKDELQAQSLDKLLRSYCQSFWPSILLNRKIFFVINDVKGKKQRPNRKEILFFSNRS